MKIYDAWEELKDWLTKFPQLNPGALLSASDVLDHIEYLELKHE